LCFRRKKRNGWNFIYIVAEFGGFLNFWGVSLVEKFMNINELDEKSILNFWLGGVVKQEKRPPRHHNGAVFTFY
jgi:hypothetical protein